jgi:hypothetical protein
MVKNGLFGVLSHDVHPRFSGLENAAGQQDPRL